MTQKRGPLSGPKKIAVVKRPLEKYPGHKPRITSDDGPQLIAKDFKHFVRPVGSTHVRTSPYYPQSSGKLERWHGTLKSAEFRDKALRDVEEARRVVGNFVTHYNEVRLDSALGYVALHDKLAGRDPEIVASRNSKLEATRAKRLGAKSRAAEQAITNTVLM